MSNFVRVSLEALVTLCSCHLAKERLEQQCMETQFIPNLMPNPISKLKVTSTDVLWNTAHTEKCDFYKTLLRNPRKSVAKTWLVDHRLPGSCTGQIFSSLFYLYFTARNSKNTSLFIEEGEDKFSYFGESLSRYNSHEIQSSIQSKLDRQPLPSKVSNNPYTIINYTAVYQTIRREPPILLKSFHTRFQRS